MTGNLKDYYEAKGFSLYYFSNAVFNIIGNSLDYIRGIEEIFGDMSVVNLMRPFQKFTVLHYFLEFIIRDIVEEDMRRWEDHDPRFLVSFLKAYKIPFSESDLDDEDNFYEFSSESNGYNEAISEIADEVFHVLFNDIQFLQKFNELCAGYIEGASFGQEFLTKTGALKRVPIPKWVRRAIFYRDKGECRECKRSLAGVINRLETERYDHIVPLARFGANDITNLQLLCEPCNQKKAANIQPVSSFYLRAFRI